MTDRTIPLRLADAVKAAFPAGGMTVAGLRRERDAGRLVVERIAGKEFVTLAAIDEMRALCRDDRKAPTSTSAKGRGRKRSGASETVPSSSAQAALMATLDKLSESLGATSRKSTIRREGNVVSATFRSPTS